MGFGKKCPKMAEMRKISKEKLRNPAKMAIFAQFAWKNFAFWPFSDTIAAF
jgi:hypothetical protein